MRMLSNRLLATIAFGLALPLSAMAQPAATPTPRGEEGGKGGVGAAGCHPAPSIRSESGTRRAFE